MLGTLTLGHADIFVEDDGIGDIAIGAGGMGANHACRTAYGQELVGFVETAPMGAGTMAHGLEPREAFGS